MLSNNKSIHQNNPHLDYWEKTKNFLRLSYDHLKIHSITYVLAWLVWIIFSSNYVFAVNESASLPQTLFIVQKHQPVNKGDYVAFQVPPDAAKHFKNSKAILTKIVVGTEGDKVSVKDRLVYVNGTPVGYAKEKSLKGEELFPIPDGLVPHGMFYVMGLHKDSLDSRYTIVGLVPTESVVGRAFPVL